MLKKKKKTFGEGSVRTAKTAAALLFDIFRGGFRGRRQSAV